MEEAADPYKILFWKNRNQWLYELARDKNLKPVSVRVALLFGTFIVPDVREYVSPGYVWLMKNGNIGSRSTLSSALDELVKNGYLEVTRRSHNPNRYCLPFDGEGEWKKPQSTISVP